VHQKFQQKYRWIEHVNIYHYAKSEVEQKFVQEEIKKRILHLNSYGFNCSWMICNPQLLQVSLFCFFLHKLLFMLKFCTIVEAYVLYPIIFLDKFFMHKLSYN